MSKILIVDDDVASCRTLQLHLRSQGHEAVPAHSVNEGLALAAAESPDLVVLDIRMPGKSGLEGLPEFKQRFPESAVIMITAFHDMESTIEAMQKGADDYIHKPIDINELDAAIDKALGTGERDGSMDMPASGGVIAGPLTMVGRSRAMKEVFKTIGLVAKQTETTNARLIAATNVDLSAKVKDGSFREDLFYRLHVVTIHLPPLRERKEDLKDLEKTLLARINRELHRNVTHISREVLECLEAYDWPGNVRELENILMKGVTLCLESTLTLELLPERLRNSLRCTPVSMIDKPIEQWSLEEMEKAHVQRVLEATRWHRGQACEVLGVSRPRLRRMIRQYGFRPPDGVKDDGGLDNED